MAEIGRWLAFDVGCLECGEDCAVIGTYASEELAQAACTAAEERQAADWHGQHSMEVFDLTAPSALVPAVVPGEVVANQQAITSGAV